MAGAGQVLAFVPFVYHLLKDREMHVADFIIFSVLGGVFITENLSNSALVSTNTTELTAQIIHLFGHFAVSLFFHGLNQRHFSGKEKIE